MRDVTNLRSSRSARLVALLLAAVCLSLSACFASHAGPKTSTETGNPSMLDSNALALHVTTNEVHINGKPGAATPGGVAIEITNLTTGKVTNTKAAADGSFDTRVDGSPDDAFVVRAGSGSTASAPVYVVRGMAAVGDGKDGALSCDQRDQLAGAQLEIAAENADTSCTVDADCEAVIEAASCHDRCQYVPVSAAGRSEIEATSAAIDAGLCASFADDGCMSVLLPCVAPPPVTCSEGHCVNPNGATLSCQQREQMAGEQITSAVAAADKTCAVDADCVLTPDDVSCLASCGAGPPVAVSQAGKAALDAAIASVEGGACSAFAAEGCHVLATPCVLYPVPGQTPVANCQNGACVRGADTCQFATHALAPIVLDCTEKVVLHESGSGLRLLPPPGSVCKGASFTLTLATRDLEWSICTPPVDAASDAWTLDTGERVLSQAEYDSAHQALAAVTVWDRSPKCGVDKEIVTLDVATANGTQTYADSFYSCNAAPGTIYVDNIDDVTTQLGMLAHP